MGTMQWNALRGAGPTEWRPDGRSGGAGRRIGVLTSDGRLFSHVSQCFARDGSVCEAYRDELAMVRALKSGSFDLILLDIDSARSFGRPVLRWLDCHATYPVPVLALGSLVDRYGLLEALEAGVDDLVLGPIDKDELYLRAHVALGRSRRARPGQGQPDVLLAGPYHLDRKRLLLAFDGEPITVTAREFALAWLFFSNPNVMFNRSQIACSVWGNEADIVDRTLEQHIYKLRKKLRLGEASGVRLRTCYSLGYKLEVAEPGACAESSHAPGRRAGERTGWRPVAQFDAVSREVLMARWEGLRQA